MIKKILEYFFDSKAKQKRTRLKAIKRRIADTTNYNQLVELVILYNKIKNEN